jgi:TetR/AcrR family fatty acid metabolism transcriptional regulator
MANDTKVKNTRDRIIDAARKLFADQGYHKTTVMEIARATDLSEAAMYEYFKGKEDLLLTIPGKWVEIQLAELEDQLFGIDGAFSKLKKYIWWMMRRAEESPLDAKIVYLFLKSNANFMESEVYVKVRTLYAKLIEIFEEGRQSGEMNPHLDPYAARVIVIGTMDHLVTRWLLKGRSYSLFDKLEETHQLLVNAFRPPVATSVSSTLPDSHALGRADAETGTVRSGEESAK